MDHMVKNMVKKVESRFDASLHRAQNEQILLQMRIKQARQQDSEQQHQHIL
jgi:hypothetical protein